MGFSERTAWELGENGFAARVREAREGGRELVDLTVSNPTACGFVYHAETLLKPLSEPGALLYQPQALGMMSARQAVSAYYSHASAHVPAERICVTTSTSEGYSFLFRLLCDPGDEVLVAAPSYPLFEFIARLDNVRLMEYPLLYDHGWLIDFHALQGAITARTRAVVVVHPNNPTGHFCSERERAALEQICSQRGLALIVDEVFLDYPLPNRAARSFACGEPKALTFVLSGLSKVCALPQMKCSWIVARGPEAEAREAMERIELIADTFLSMNAPVQHALPQWLAGRHSIQEQIRQRMQRNVATLDAATAGSACQRLEMDAGWAAVLRVPRTVHGVAFSEAALEAGVVVQPGELYGLPQGRAVLSLLTPAVIWDAGLDRLPLLAH